jgi:Tol biopolymer transport system component
VTRGLLAMSLATVGLVAACVDRSEEKKEIVSEVAAARVAPETGDELVFEQDVGGNVDLYVIPAAGGTSRRLTEDTGHDSLARWMPDGQRIVFTSSRTGHPQLWELDVEGGPPRPVRENDATEYQADPSPDGKRLAFLTNLDGPERLVVMDRATGEVSDLVRHGQKSIFGNPDWSPDATQIVFSSNWKIGHQIYVVDVASGETRRLSPLTSGGCEPRFDREGRRVAYTTRGHLGSTSRIVAHDLETGEEEVIVDWPALNYDVAFSPDGTEIAFASNISGTFAIYRQRLSDGKAWRVTFGDGDARYPDYRPRR